MSNLLADSRIRNFFTRFIYIILLFIAVNYASIYVNKYYLDQKIHDENEDLVDIFKHLVEQRDFDTAIVFLDHYVHTNEVKLILYDENNQVLLGELQEVNAEYVYQVYTAYGNYKLYVDNSKSKAAILTNDDILYTNIAILSIYTIVIIIILLQRRRRNNKIIHDISMIQDLLNTTPNFGQKFYYHEFEHIYHDVEKYIKNLDLLKEKREMNVSSLVHDLKTPLTILMNYLDQKNVITKKDEITKSLADINQIATDLIDEKYSNKRVLINASELTYEAIRTNSSVLKRRGLKINTKINKDVHVMWNKRDYKRILNNLISNAYYYSLENSKIDIKINNEQRFNLIFTNKIPDGSLVDVDSIFKRGYRLDKSQNREGKGLGMYIVKLLVEGNNGTITVKKIDNSLQFHITI